MSRSSSTLLYLIAIGLFFGVQPDARSQQKVIFDTDMAWDWDDVGAMAVLHALADLGEAEILGMGISINGTSADWSPHTIDIINTYYNRPDIPIGKAISGGSVRDQFGQWDR